MTEPLFFEPDPEESLEKLAAEVDLSEDPNMWPQEILQELYKQVPYIVDYQPHVEMKRVDAERAYGIGHVEIRNQTEAPQDSTEEELGAAGIRTVRIPFVIKEKKLCPFDLLMNDQSKMVPLTENRLRHALFRPQALDVTSKTPGDQSMVGQLYPPQRQNYGLTGGSVIGGTSGFMGKTGAVEPSDFEKFVTPEPEKSLEELNKEALLFTGPAYADFLRTKERQDIHAKKRSLMGLGGATAGGLGGGFVGRTLGQMAGEATGLGSELGGLIGTGLGGLGGAGLGYVAGTELAGQPKKPLSIREALMKSGSMEKKALLIPGAAMAGLKGLEMRNRVPGMVATGLGAGLGAGTGGYLGLQAGKALGSAAGYPVLGSLLGTLGGGLLGGGLGYHAGKWAGSGFPIRPKQPGLFQQSRDLLFGKQASVLDSVLSALDPKDHERFLDEVAKEAQYLNANHRHLSKDFSGSLEKVVEAQPVQMKLASWTYFTPPTVVQLSKRSNGYLMKMASPLSWAPSEHLLDRGAVVRGFGEKVAMDVDTSGAVTLKEGPGEEVPVGEEPAEEFIPIQEAGSYKVKDITGEELVGYVVPELIDTNGETIPVKLFTNGSQVAVQSDIVGEPAGEAGNLPAGPVSKHGAFYGAGPDGNIQMTVPFEIESSQAVGGDPTTFVGTCFDGRPIQVSVQPNIQVPMGNDETLMVPDSWQWLPLDGADSVTLLGGEQEEGTEELEEKVGSLQIRSDGSTFTFSGPPVEKLAYDERAGLGVDDSMFLMAGLGIHQVKGAEKLAEAINGGGVAMVPVGNHLNLDSDMRKQAEAHLGGIQDFIDRYIKHTNLVKTAATIPDPTTVDTVLSLGFVNPDNIMNYVSYLPDIDDAQTKLCELLFGARLGLSNVPQASLERAIRSVEEAIEGLKILAFQGS